MLKLKSITKDYIAGDTAVHALKGISIEFRKSEFVAILGHSGCGKTTLLNIIGGLDQYTKGDLIISGRSTKEYKDSDWDAYRNHSVGFVFQSYNLIPHQTILSNVELALTLSGVSKSERKKRAKEALRKVGLEEQINKKPNQLSGGQMQRVAIARALVNDPEILLADEATGALDSETSIQIMDLLKEISQDRLVIMVTHNPELAEQYATRTVKLLDGLITDDSAPYDSENEQDKNDGKKIKKSHMSLFTALSLSLNNLMTKKTRTLLTSFAGSIGIIGIALILSVSTGVQAYINRVQEDTLSSYPITLQAETVDMSSLVKSFMDISEEEEKNRTERDPDRIYASSVMRNLANSLNSLETEKNNLKAFKEFIDGSEEFRGYTTAIKYSYDFDMNIFTKDPDGKVVKSDAMKLISDIMSSVYGTSSSAMSAYGGYSQGGYNVWEELLPSEDDGYINSLITEQYDLIYGEWPKNYNDIVIVVNQNNEISDIVLYTLGLKTSEELTKDAESAMGHEMVEVADESWSYSDICSREFKLILSADFYQLGTDGKYTNLTENEAGLNYLYGSDKTISLNICGILRPNEDAVANMINGSIGYTSALTEHVIALTEQNELIKKQTADPSYDILSGLRFKSDDDEEIPNSKKASDIKEYFSSLTPAEKAAIYTETASVPSEEYLNGTAEAYMANLTRENMVAMMLQSYSEQMGVEDTSAVENYINEMDDETLKNYIKDAVKQTAAEQYAQGVREQLGGFTTDELCAMFDAAKYTEEEYAALYDKYMPSDVSESTYEKNLKLLGYVDKSDPRSIGIFASTFADKDEIARMIDEYNDSASEENEISYTDLFALIMSSISTIINAISYVLIAFVAISLVVSSIMIGVITYISVLERTKEIGILRAIGASKKDISRVFNAETLIVGFVSGALGVLITVLLIIPLNIILRVLTNIAILKAILPVGSMIVLVLISMFLTFIAGLIPSSIAAKKDPVIALRSE